jgi:hypothetical protein
MRSARAQNAGCAEIALKLRIPPAAAAARLQAVGKVPPADLAFLHVNGPKVQQGTANLTSVSTVPPADLAYLQANAAKVAQATKGNPGLWQTWWWICFIGQHACIPLVFLLTGRGSPRKARADDRARDDRQARDGSATGRTKLHGCSFGELSPRETATKTSQPGSLAAGGRRRSLRHSTR